jgi:hypothetical protein
MVKHTIRFCVDFNIYVVENICTSICIYLHLYVCVYIDVHTMLEKKAHFKHHINLIPVFKIYTYILCLCQCECVYTNKMYMNLYMHILERYNFSLTEDTESNC